MTSFLLKPIKDSFVDSVAGTVEGAVAETVVLVPGIVVAVVPGIAVGVGPGTVEGVGPGTAAVGTVEGAVAGTVGVDPGTVLVVVVGTAEAGHIPAVGEVAVQAQTEGGQAVREQSRASELHFDQFLALAGRTEDYRSLKEIQL